MKRERGVVLSVAVLFAAMVMASPTAAQEGKPRDEMMTIAERTAGLECQPGFVSFCWDAKKGALLLEIDRFGEAFLYLISLASGAGENAIGLDRGMTREKLVRFERVGPHVLLVETNTRYRAETKSAALRHGVEEQFPISVLRGWQIVAEEEGRVLVDATQFYLRDALNVAARLKGAGQGNFKLDSSNRSVIYLQRTKAFPRNTEVEALLTFASDDPGPLVRRSAPDGRSLTLRVHHSFVALPERPYRPRRFDPRVGVFPVTFKDYAQPLSEALEQRWIVRWRLEKVSPRQGPGGSVSGQEPAEKDAPRRRSGKAGRAGGSVSEGNLSMPVKPIVYYLDPAMPEPIRSAVREGALWWNQVFEAAGLKDAFQVRDLPADTDPRDVRYSIIQWGHRADRGWSWGSPIVDPRTGEILKAVVFMDSHRMRTDYRLWTGLGRKTGGGRSWQRYECHAGAWGVPAWVAALDPTTTPEEFVLARLRQLAAHEVGHTLGLAHNFAASTYGRASVMDYPAPLVRLVNGQVDLKDAYRTGPGDYDRFAIRYAYSAFAPEEEAAALERMVAEGLKQGLVFLSDRDARPASAAEPRANLWDNRADPRADFRNAQAVRRVLLAEFGANAIRSGEPVALLEERLAPVYFHHRFALEAATKMVGGMEYVYEVAGDGQAGPRLLEPAAQREALGLLLEALKPEALALPEDVVARLAPRPFGYGETPEDFNSKTWPAFDELGAARMLATMIVERLLNRERAARLVAFAMRQEEALTLTEVVEELLQATWGQHWPTDPKPAALQRVAQRAVLDGLLKLAGDKDATVEVRAVAEWALADLLDDLKDQEHPEPMGEAARQLAERDIRRFFNRTDAVTERSRALEAPPGSPIGRR